MGVSVAGASEGEGDDGDDGPGGEALPTMSEDEAPSPPSVEATLEEGCSPVGLVETDSVEMAPDAVEAVTDSVGETPGRDSVKTVLDKDSIGSVLERDLVRVALDEAPVAATPDDDWVAGTLGIDSTGWAVSWLDSVEVVATPETDSVGTTPVRDSVSCSESVEGWLWPGVTATEVWATVEDNETVPSEGGPPLVD